jgi:hypothetical protein
VPFFNLFEQTRFSACPTMAAAPEQPNGAMGTMHIENSYHSLPERVEDMILAQTHSETILNERFQATMIADEPCGAQANLFDAFPGILKCHC